MIKRSVPNISRLLVLPFTTRSAAPQRMWIAKEIVFASGKTFCALA